MKADFFAGNRAELVASLKGGVLALSAFTKMQGSADDAASFNQDANFWYLTGIEHPDWRLIMDGAQGVSWLVAPTLDAVHQTFNGGLSFETAKVISGVDGVLDQAGGRELLHNLARKHQTVYVLGEAPYEKHADFVLNPAHKKLRTSLKRMFTSVKDCRQEIARIRAIKQPEEVEAMAQAAGLTVAALQKLTAMLGSCKYEYEAEAELSYYFRRHGATHAFEPIVASGANACTLHYSSNSTKIQGGQLLLIDVGARVGHYPGDVTRTYAMEEPTARQKAVHRAVREAEQQVIQILRPGLGLKEYSHAVGDIMKEALLSLGLMKNQSDEKNYRRYFPHAISHGLGIDVHESLGGYKELLPGMVLTVEPGIYIPEEGIGVRIEDDVLITENGHENLTAGLSTDL